MTTTILDQLRETQARYKTRPVEVGVEFATEARSVLTLEGPVSCVAGDAIVTGTAGEQWPIPRATFDKKYMPAGGQPAGTPGRYAKRTAFVEAVQLEQAISVPLSGNRGILQGQAGDWCVWYGPDDAAIVAKDIFPKLYEAA